MAITQAVCNSFKVEILKGLHDFTATTGNTFKLALFDSEATLNASTTTYATSADEVPDSGTYAEGGGALTSVTPVLSSSTAVCDFDDISFTSATISAVELDKTGVTEVNAPPPSAYVPESATSSALVA